MYHRIFKSSRDPWELCVSPEHFSEHLEVIKKLAQPCSLKELSRFLMEDNLPSNAIAVTFDDGYTDNLTNAKPLLVKHEIPATVFISSGYINHKVGFWWDQLTDIIFHTKVLPNSLNVKISEELIFWKNEEQSILTKEAGIDQPTVQKNYDNFHVRMNLYMFLYEKLIALPIKDQATALKQILTWADYFCVAQPDHIPMSAADLLTLIDGNLIDIGAHTVSHPLLPSLPRETQYREIIDSKSSLEEITQRPVSFFAYPFGKFDQVTLDIVKQAGFMSACTTEQNIVNHDTMRYTLPRLAVKDWDGEQFSIMLQSWLSGKHPSLIAPKFDINTVIQFPLYEFQRKTGELRGNTIECIPGKNLQGHCLYGSDFTICHSGKYRIFVSLEQRNFTGAGRDVVIDVYENRYVCKVLAELEISKSNRYHLDFIAESGYRVEFRVYWREQSWLKVKEIQLIRLS